jgi:hypothetical protein
MSEITTEDDKKRSGEMKVDREVMDVLKLVLDGEFVDEDILPELLKTNKGKLVKGILTLIPRVVACDAKIDNLNIEIINVFRNGVSDIKTVEEIAMKKPKMVPDLLTVIDVCIESYDARARLLESRGKETSQKKVDHEVNIADWEDHRDRGDRGFHGKQSSEQKERRHFRCLGDSKKWCEIHRTMRHNLEEYKTFLYQKKMPPPAAPAS